MKKIIIALIFVIILFVSALCYGAGLGSLTHAPATNPSEFYLWDGDSYEPFLYGTEVVGSNTVYYVLRRTVAGRVRYQFLLNGGRMWKEGYVSPGASTPTETPTETVLPTETSTPLPRYLSIVCRLDDLQATLDGLPEEYWVIEIQYLAGVCNNILIVAERRELYE